MGSWVRRSWLIDSRRGRDDVVDAAADRYQSVVHRVEARALLLCESQQTLCVGLFDVAKIFVNHAQLFPLFGELPLTRLGIVSATPTLAIRVDGGLDIELPIDRLVSAWLSESQGENE